MRLTVLGSGTGVPREDRGAAGYVVEAGGDVLLLDCGPGTITRLLRNGFDFRRIERVFLSHRHPDHCLDLVALIFANNWTPDARRVLRVAGPPGTGEWLQSLYGLFPALEPRSWRVEVEDWSPGFQAAGDDWRATAGPVEHGDVPALAWRIESQGRSLAYSGDSGECDGLVEVARDADLLVIECSFPDSVPGMESHLTASGCGRIATRAGARRVLLTHFYPQADAEDVWSQCRSAYAGPVDKASDGMRVEIHPRG